MKQNFFKIFALVGSVVVILVVLVGVFVYWFSNFEISNKEMKASNDSDLSMNISNGGQIIAYNCESSGGTFKGSECACPKEQGEKLKYDPKTGYCMTSFGIAGGYQGEVERKLQELEMLKNQ